MLAPVQPTGKQYTKKRRRVNPMQRSETPRAAGSAAKRGIRWGRIALAAFLAEVAVVLIIGAVILAHRLWIAPGQTEAEYRAFGELAGYYAGPAGGALMTFLFVLWVGRKLDSGFVLHGLLIGIAGVLLTAGFIVVAK